MDLLPNKVRQRGEGVNFQKFQKKPNKEIILQWAANPGQDKKDDSYFCLTYLYQHAD